MAYIHKYDYIYTFDEPGPNQTKTSITKYYRSNNKIVEKQRDKKLFDYVASIYTQMSKTINDPEYVDVWEVELPELHKHRTGPKKGKIYTLEDSISDLHKQLSNGNNPPESMVNRWNIGFGQLSLEDKFGINPITSSPTGNNFNNLFE